MKKFLLTILSTLLILNSIGQAVETIENLCDTITTQKGSIFIVELTRIEFDSTHHKQKVKIAFFRVIENKKKLINTFSIDKDPVIGCSPKKYDYNGDGNVDYSFVSNAAGRGANELRTLFIYNPLTNRFSFIKNSEGFPNIIYNSKLKCMDSWAFHSGTTQYFLKLEQDSLIPFIAISINGIERVLYKYENGKSFIIKSDTIEDSMFPRYIDYNPFEEYKN